MLDLAVLFLCFIFLFRVGLSCPVVCALLLCFVLDKTVMFFVLYNWVYVEQ